MTDIYTAESLQYDFHKIHKPNVPFRPILSMVGSAQNRLAKWLVGILEPEIKLFSNHPIYDSFTFTKMILNTSINPNNSFLCSFDISSF